MKRRYTVELEVEREGGDLELEATGTVSFHRESRGRYEMHDPTVESVLSQHGPLLLESLPARTLEKLEQLLIRAALDDDGDD